MTNVKKGQVDFYFIFDKKSIPVFLTMKIKIYLSTTKFYLAHILIFMKCGDYCIQD